MSNDAHYAGGERRVERLDDLLSVFTEGEKPPADWRIGCEHEKFLYHRRDLSSPSYDGPAGIAAILSGMADHGLTPVLEDGHVIALSDPENGGSVSLEPAGQLELSGAPVIDTHAVCAELAAHLDLCARICDPLDVGALALGFSPDKTRESQPIMPKSRYDIMRAYMPRVGSHGLDMMLRTCTAQINLDYGDEADMVRKLRLSLSLQPIATALFANSPLREGRPNGFLSYRSQVWLDTDPARCGMLPQAFLDGFGYEDYMQYALDVPMYFVSREGRHLDASGLSFRDFCAGKLPILPGELPTLDDWRNHLSTAFPEVRLKSFLEMRGADVGPAPFICALSAFWVGLLYDARALDAAWELVRGWTAQDREQLRRLVPRLGLRAPLPDGRTVRDLAHELLDIAAMGLNARDRRGLSGQTETIYLDPLRELVDEGQTLAERALAVWADGGIPAIYDGWRLF